MQEYKARTTQLSTQNKIENEFYFILVPYNTAYSNQDSTLTSKRKYKSDRALTVALPLT